MTAQAQISTPPMAEATPPQELDDLENPNDWEYEYSTTDTDTYYVTLDLTVPDQTPEKGVINSTDQRKITKGRILNFPQKPEARSLDVGATPARIPRTIDDIGGDNSNSPDSSRSGSEDEQSNIQIMGLHSRNPIVAYKGTVFSCQWTENLGTELLFTEHDPNSTLPVLKHLPGHVDLLAASSVRIISNPVHVEPKTQYADTLRSRPKHNGRQACVKDPTLLIPVGTQASKKRKAQARFLERLMEIKEERGDNDEVTVNTLKKFSRSEWREYLAKQRHLERKKMEKIAKTNKSGAGALKANEKLEDLDREDEKAEELQRRWLSQSRLRGAGRTRMKDRGHVLNRSSTRLDNETTPRSDDGMLYAETGSVPTPQRWEMENNGQNDGEDGLDEDMEDYEGELDEGMDESMSYENGFVDDGVDGEDEDAEGGDDAEFE